MRVAALDLLAVQLADPRALDACAACEDGKSPLHRAVACLEECGAPGGRQLAEGALRALAAAAGGHRGGLGFLGAHLASAPPSAAEPRGRAGMQEQVGLLLAAETQRLLDAGAGAGAGHEGGATGAGGGAGAGLRDVRLVREALSLLSLASAYGDLALGRAWAPVLGALWRLARGEAHPQLAEERRVAAALRDTALGQACPSGRPVAQRGMLGRCS